MKGAVKYKPRCEIQKASSVQRKLLHSNAMQGHALTLSRTSTLSSESGAPEERDALHDPAPKHDSLRRDHQDKIRTESAKVMRSCVPNLRTKSENLLPGCAVSTNQA
eukprot:1574975-Pleurochrysis_carterae.AAC.4